MSSFIELQEFYKNINRPLDPSKGEIGHFNIFKVEDLILPKHRKLTYSRRDFFKVSLVNGHSRIHYADNTLEVTESALVFTNPMIPYHWEIIGAQQTGFVCIFTEDFFNKFGNIREYPVFQNSDSAVLPLTPEEFVYYNNLFLRIQEELNSDYSFKYDSLRSLLMEVVHSAQKMRPARSISIAGSNASERITSLFLELLERQFPIEIGGQQIRLHSPSAFASQLNVHVNHLNKALKESTGQTTSRLIIDRLLQESKILLKSTNWTIAEIAWGLGFEEANHFSTFFKNRVHISPNKFRQSKID